MKLLKKESFSIWFCDKLLNLYLYFVISFNLSIDQKWIQTVLNIKNAANMEVDAIGMIIVMDIIVS